MAQSPRARNSQLLDAYNLGSGSATPPAPSLEGNYIGEPQGLKLAQTATGRSREAGKLVSDCWRPRGGTFGFCHTSSDPLWASGSAAVGVAAGRGGFDFSEKWTARSLHLVIAKGTNKHCGTSNKYRKTQIQQKFLSHARYKNGRNFSNYTSNICVFNKWF